MRALLGCLLLAAPAFAAAKTKVLIDAPKPVAAVLSKALKAKHTIGNASVPEEPTAGDVNKACLAQGAVAIVTARAAGDLYNFMVLNCADGSPLSTFRIKWGKKPPKALPKGDVTVLMQAVADGKPASKAPKAAPPPEEKPAPTEQKPAEEKPPPAAAETPKPRREEPSEPPPPPQAREEVVKEQPRESSSSTRPQAVRVGLGVKVFSRLFGYTDDIFNKLSTYKLPAGPAVALDADLYPAAFVTSGVAANIGALVYFDYAVGIASKSADGTKFGTNAMLLKLAATYRLNVGPLQLNPFLGYSLDTYSITAPAGATKPNIPNVGYSGLRGGVQARMHLIGPVSVQLSFAGQFLLSTGEIGSSAFFPHAKAGGLDAQLAIPVAILDHVEIKLQGDYTRFWYSMNPVPGDMYIAGGALDVYASGSLIVAFTY